jgi:glucose-6-phosphate isomerase
MTASSDLWQRYNQYLLTDESLGFSLDISRVRFPDDFFETMRVPMTAALAAMRELEAGAIANADEQRMVGHYWLRAAERAPEESLTKEINETLAQIKQFVAAVHGGEIVGGKGTFSNVLVVGIGGSALGPQFVAEALGTRDDLLTPYFLDNTDPDGISRTLARLEGQLDRTLVIVISKSGGTPETRNGMLETKAAYERAGIDFAQHAVAVTSVGSKLERIATDDHWLRQFPMWDWVGGRTSETSAVGLLPAALQGIDLDGFLRGAAQMDELTRREDMLQNPAALLALMWYHSTDGRGSKDMVILPYKDRLALFSRYLQQLVMESLGKELNRKGEVVHQGLAVYGNKGSTDQHAYVQQLRDGIANFFATFIQVLEDQQGTGLEVEPGVTSGDFLCGFLLGTQKALYDNGRDSILIAVERVDAPTVGALIALYERAVGLYAELIDVNAYHQPGVEAGKQAAAEALELQRTMVTHLDIAKGPQTAAKLAQAAGAADVVTAYKILQHLAANPGRGVRKVSGTTPADTLFASQP